MKGFRGWNIDGNGKLRALVTGYYWEPGINTAECECIGTIALFGRDYHSAPAEGGTCGLWMRETFAELVRGDLVMQVAGVVECWGRCIRHELGWRCQRMRIIALLDETKLFVMPPGYPAAMEQYYAPHVTERSRAIKLAGLRYDVPVIHDVLELMELA